MPTTDQGADVAPRSGAPAEAAALADLRSAVGHLHPDDPAELVAIADDLRALGSPAAAVPFYEAAVEQGVPGAVYRLGVAHHEAGDAAEAFRCFELAGLAGDALGRSWRRRSRRSAGTCMRPAAGTSWRRASRARPCGSPRCSPSWGARRRRRPPRGDVGRELGGGGRARAQRRPEPGRRRRAARGWAGTGEARVAATLADLYVRAGRGPDAEDLLEQAALAGEPTARTSLGCSASARAVWPRRWPCGARPPPRRRPGGGAAGPLRLTPGRTQKGARRATGSVELSVALPGAEGGRAGGLPTARTPLFPGERLPAATASDRRAVSVARGPPHTAGGRTVRPARRCAGRTGSSSTSCRARARCPPRGG